MLSSLLVGIAGVSLDTHYAFSAGVKDELTRNLNTSGSEGGFNSGTKLSAVVGAVIKTFLGLLGVVFIIMIIYAGFNWIQAQGEDSKITEARKMIIHSTIGLIVIMAAYSITLFVLKAVQGATNTLTQ